MNNYKPLIYICPIKKNPLWINISEIVKIEKLPRNDKSIIDIYALSLRNGEVIEVYHRQMKNICDLFCDKEF